MKAIKFSRRLLLRLVPISTLGAYFSSGTIFAQQPVTATTDVSGGPAAAESFLLQLVSLVPKSTTPAGIVTTGLSQPLDVAPIIGLPLLVRVDRDDLHSSKAQEFYSVKVVSKNGTLISEMNIADRSAATFVDQRIQINLTVLGR